MIAAVGLLSCLPAWGQAAQRPWEYWNNPDAYFDNQGEILFELIDRTLDRNPATDHPSEERQLALASLDALLHDTYYDDCEAFHAFIEGRVAKVLSALDLPPRKGLEIFKLYNDGFIVRSGSGCVVGFDLCSARSGMTFIPQAQMQKLVRHCDMLFISHGDPDHADAAVVDMAANLGIPVYGPEDYQNSKVEGLRMEHFNFKYLAGIVPVRKVRVQALPGHQDNLQNNIYVVTFPDGNSVAHCGDQYSEEDMAWLSSVSEKLTQPLDVLIIDAWALNLRETIEGFAPRLVIFGHENEMVHGIDHREALWLSQYKSDAMGLGVPGVVMTWGESYRYNRSSLRTLLRLK